MQTILGANGVIAQELSRALASRTPRIRQVSRHPARVNATDELFPADLLDAKATSDAVAGSEGYGPGAVQSIPHATVFERLRAGKTPQWIGNPAAVHTFTFTPDTGPAVALLGNSPDAYGQTWHLPARAEPMTGAEFVRLACAQAGTPFKLQVAPRWMLRLMGWFVPVLRENDEMMYQLDRDYRFDSSKIAAAYGLRATPYAEGITRTLGTAT